MSATAAFREVAHGKQRRVELSATFDLTSGPSGTAYRFLSVWLILGGAEKQLPLLRLAMAGLLNGGHHSLIEVMAVLASISSCRAPERKEEPQ